MLGRFDPFSVCRALLALGSETTSEVMRASAARRGSVVAAARTSQNQMHSVARGRIGSRAGLFGWRSIALEGARMIEPMQPDPIEAVRPQSAAEQLAARVAGHALAQSAVVHTAHRWLKLEEPRDV